MQYYIVKKGDTFDNILNRFGITYQNFISLNNSDIKNILKEGNKIKIGNNRLSNNFKDNINRIYQSNNEIIKDSIQCICPYCKNIIDIPKQ